MLPFPSQKADSWNSIDQRVMRNRIIESPFIDKVAVVSIVAVTDTFPGAIHLDMVKQPLNSFSSLVADFDLSPSFFLITD